MTAAGQRDHRRPAPAMLLIEAGIAMVAASLAIRLLSFDRLARLLERRLGAARHANPEQAYWMARSLEAWGRRLPWRARCFETGVAAAWMLRRRRLAYRLGYGAANRADRLDAHVWVSSGPHPVVGYRNRDDYLEIAAFSG